MSISQNIIIVFVFVHRLSRLKTCIHVQGVPTCREVRAKSLVLLETFEWEQGNVSVEDLTTRE